MKKYNKIFKECLIQRFVKIAFLVFIFLSCPKDPIIAQYQNVKVWGAVNSYEPQECSIVISPSNTNYMAAASNRNNYYYSTDAGLTWRHGFVHSPYGVIGDPGVLAGADGKFYYFHLVNDLSRVVCHKQNSIGGSWTEGTSTGLNGTKDNDKDWGAVNVKNNYLYLTWAEFDEHGSTDPNDSSAIKLSRSTDEGATWSVPVQISNKKGNAWAGSTSCHSPMPAIGPGSEVYVTWWSREGLMFDKSTDFGETWLNTDIKVTPNHIEWLFFNIQGVQRSPGFPVISCDLSDGIYKGNIYICWTDQRKGSRDTDVWMSKSSDGGLTWCAAKRVNDDPPGKHQFFAWMTIDQITGYLYFVFYDRRNYADARTDVYMACSKDGGETFENYKVSETPFTPEQSDFIGDYIGVSAHNNIVRPIWTRVDEGELSLWTAVADPVTDMDDKSKKILPDEFELKSVYPNPFNPSTKIQYQLSKPGNVSLKVFDVLGNEISTLIEEYQTADSYEVIWEAGNIVSGTYFVRLQYERKVKTQKVVLAK